MTRFAVIRFAPAWQLQRKIALKGALPMTASRIYSPWAFIFRHSVERDMPSTAAVFSLL